LRVAVVQQQTQVVGAVVAGIALPLELLVAVRLLNPKFPLRKEPHTR
jgi:hypothetical protein